MKARYRRTQPAAHTHTIRVLGVTVWSYHPDAKPGLVSTATTTRPAR